MMFFQCSSRKVWVAIATITLIAATGCQSDPPSSAERFYKQCMKGWKHKFGDQTAAYCNRVIDTDPELSWYHQ